MSIADVPRELKDWNLQVIDGLVKIRDIESDRFDFKGGDWGDLAKHICAMANYGEGIIVLGVDEKKNGEYLLEFEKKGYPPGKEDSIGNQINQYIAQVEPTPRVSRDSIKESNGTFYPVIKIEGLEKDKPYMLKNKGVIYVRINSSTVIASKIAIYNLFSNLRQRISDVRGLKASCTATRSALILTSRVIGYDNTSSRFSIPPLDLTFLKKAAMDAEWFLIETGQYGEIFENGHRAGMQTHIHSLETMNTYIQAFNWTGHPSDKRIIMDNLTLWKENHSNFKGIVAFLQDIEGKCEAFIKDKSSLV